MVQKAEMKITLLDHTNPDILVDVLSMPYDSKNLTRKHLTKIWNMGHRSFARQGIATFKIENVSQSLLRQLSRHPHTNPQVKSTRYCDMSNASVVIPSNKSMMKLSNKYIMDVEYFKKAYLDDMNEIMKIYKKWKDLEDGTGEKELDIAKNFLPLASTTDLIISANYQAWYEFLQLRNCTRAENEIRQMSLEITRQLKELVPELFGSLGCRADELGYCNEFKPCGKYPNQKEVLNREPKGEYKND